MLLRIVILKKQFFVVWVNYIDLAVAWPELPELKRWVELPDATLISRRIMFRLNCPRFLQCSALFVYDQSLASTRLHSCFQAGCFLLCLISSGQRADIDGGVSLLYEPWPSLAQYPR